MAPLLVAQHVALIQCMLAPEDEMMMDVLNNESPGRGRVGTQVARSLWILPNTMMRTPNLTLIFKYQLGDYDQ
jgi:hypothetical protein